VSTTDKRKHQRIPQRDAAFIFVEVPPDVDGKERKVFGCMTADISEGGVQVSLPSQLAPGALVELRIAALKPPTTFRLQGKVAWAQKAGRNPSWHTGIEIIHGEDKYSQAWFEYVRAVQATLTAPAIFRLRFCDISKSS
jgi:Tfp pilus assembly protein PilZ